MNNPSQKKANVVQARSPRREWVAPVVTDLPRLTDLTLQTGGFIPGEGDLGGGGSTVIA